METEIFAEIFFGGGVFKLSKKTKVVRSEIGISS